MGKKKKSSTKKQTQALIKAEEISKPNSVAPKAKHDQIKNKNILVHMLIILATGLAVYMGTFNSPFMWDEVPLLKDNPIIRDWSYFFEPSRAKGLLGYDSFVNRYVTYITFAANYQLHGLSPTGYHIFNVLMHLINGLLVYWMASLIFATPFMDKSNLKERSSLIALFTALIFIAHPLNTEAVTYVFQRHASLVATFYILSVCSYLSWRISGGRWKYILTIIAAVLAMKTKENAFTLPIIITLIEFMFFSGDIKKRVMGLTPLLLTMFIIPISVVGINKSAGAMIGGMTDATLDYVSMGNMASERTTYLFTQFKVITTYIQMFFIPIGQNIDHQFSRYSEFFNPNVIIPFAMLCSIFAFGVLLALRSKKGAPELKVIALGTFWFFIALSVESSIIPIPMVINEYRVYLPGVGLTLSMITGIFYLGARYSNNSAIWDKRLITIMAVLVLTVAVAGFMRNSLWRDPVSLWGDAAKKSPTKTRVIIHLGLAYDETGQYEKAIETYSHVVALDTDNAEVRYDMGVVYAKMGLQDKAIDEYNKALSIDPSYPSAHNNLGTIYYKQGDLNRAALAFEAAVRGNPQNLNTRSNLSIIYMKSGKFKQARQHLNKIIYLAPNYPDVHTKLGVVNFQTGRLNEALTSYSTALKYQPRNPNIHHNMGLIYLERKQYQLAITKIEDSLKLNPTNEAFKQNLNLALKLSKQNKSAQ